MGIIYDVVDIVRLRKEEDSLTLMSFERMECSWSGDSLWMLTGGSQSRRTLRTLQTDEYTSADLA